MDKMTLYTLAFVSIPESILNLFIGFLLIGNKEYLKPSKQNLFRFVSVISIMAVASYVIRSCVPIGIISFLLQVICYILSIKAVYRMKFSRAVACVTIFAGVLLTIEVLYIPPFMTYIKKALGDAYQDDLLRLICTIPERLIQIAVVVSLWNSSTVFINFKKYKRMQKMATCVLFLLYAIEIMFAFTFVLNLDKINLASKIIEFIICIGFVVFNSMLFVFISKYSQDIVKSESEKFDIKNRKAIDDIRRMKELLGND